MGKSERNSEEISCQYNFFYRLSNDLTTNHGYGYLSSPLYNCTDRFEVFWVFQSRWVASLQKNCPHMPKFCHSPHVTVPSDIRYFDDLSYTFNGRRFKFGILSSELVLLPMTDPHIRINLRYFSILATFFNEIFS